MHFVGLFLSSLLKMHGPKNKTQLPPVMISRLFSHSNLILGYLKGIGGGGLRRRTRLPREEEHMSKRGGSTFTFKMWLSSFVWAFVTMTTVSMAQCAGAELSGQRVARYNAYLSHCLRKLD